MAGKSKLKTICNDIDTLEPSSRMEILEHIINSLKLDLSKAASAKTHRISELKGLGAEIWKDVDVESYLKKERSEWRS